MSNETEITTEQAQEPAPEQLVVQAAQQPGARGTVVGPVTAVTMFATWLTERDQAAGPFGLYWGPEPALALVKEFCEAQGWV